MELLRELGLPIGLVVALVLLAAVVRGAVKLLAELRISIANDEMNRKLCYLDQQLSEFYLPITARLGISKGLFRFFSDITTDGHYHNSVLGIQAAEPQALRDIVVRRIFLPLNREVERLIIEKSHWKSQDDETDLSVFVQHYLLWRSLEESVLDGSIEGYDAVKILAFPAEEGVKFKEMTSRLVNERNSIRSRIMKFMTT